MNDILILTMKYSSILTQPKITYILLDLLRFKSYTLVREAIAIILCPLLFAYPLIKHDTVLLFCYQYFIIIHSSRPVYFPVCYGFHDNGLLSMVQPFSLLHFQLSVTTILIILIQRKHS